MKTRRYLALTFAAALLLNAAQAMAGHMPGERHTWRTVFAVAGAFGGGVLGGTIGGSSGLNMSRNITTGLLVGGIGGGVGGFFLGRMVDKSKARNNPPDLKAPSQQRISEAQSRAMDIVAKKFAARLLPPVAEPAPGK